MGKKEVKEVEEIDLLRLALALWHKLWLLVLAGVICAGIAFGYTKLFITPLFRTSVTIYVNNMKHTTTDSVTTSDLSASQQLVNTYVNILSSDAVLEKVIEEGQYDLTAQNIRDMMSASAVNNTEIFRVYITSADPQLAADLANTIAQVAPAEIAEIVEGSSVKIVDYAKVPTQKSSPSTMKNTMMGGLIGLVLAAGVIVLIELFDTRIKSEEDLDRLFPDLPILGVIPDLMQVSSSDDTYGYGYAYREDKKCD